MVPPSGIGAELPPTSDASAEADGDAAANELISDVALRFETSHAWWFDASWAAE